MQNLHTTTPLSRFPKKMVPEVPCLLCASRSVCVCRRGGVPGGEKGVELFNDSRESTRRLSPSSFPEVKAQFRGLG